MANRDEAIKQHILPFAKACGYDFTIEDFSLPEGEVDEAELQSVSGGYYDNLDWLNSGVGGCNNCKCTKGGGGSGPGPGIDPNACFCFGPGHGGVSHII